MEYTKGEWKAVFDGGLCIKDADNRKLALLFDGGYEEKEANARLIVATVNACIKLNPNNPMAVAQSIEKMYEALHKIRAISPETIIYDIANTAISKVEDRNG